jgi:hypothetical protein
MIEKVDRSLHTTYFQVIAGTLSIWLPRADGRGGGRGRRRRRRNVYSKLPQ